MPGIGDNCLTWIALLLCICGLCHGVSHDGCDCGGTGNGGNTGCGGCGGILGGCGSCR